MPGPSITNSFLGRVDGYGHKCVPNKNRSWFSAGVEIWSHHAVVQGRLASCRAALICFSTTKVEARIWYAHKPGMMFA